MADREYATLEYLFSWGWGDVDKLEDYMATGYKWGVDPYDIPERVEEMGFSGKDLLEAGIDPFIGAAIDVLFHVVMHQFKREVDNGGLAFLREIGYTMPDRDENGKWEDWVDEIVKWAEKFEDDFSPYINGLDSWFNNLLDEVDLSKGNYGTDRLEAFKEIIEHALSDGLIPKAPKVAGESEETEAESEETEIEEPVEEKPDGASPPEGGEK